MADVERLRAMWEADPDATRDLIKRTMSKMLVPHGGGQRDVYEAAERFLVLNAGRRWGKTKIGAAKALKVTRKPDRMVWWVAPTYKIVKRGYREVLRQIPEGVLAEPPPSDRSFDGGRAVILRFKNGSQMEFYSAERPEGMLGEGVHFAVLDEAAIMPRNVWEQVVSPTLTDFRGGALFISTPRGRNWFFENWLRGQDPQQPDWNSWTFTTEDNPTLPEGEVGRMKEGMSQLVFEQEVMAQFVSDAAAVFRFDRKFVQQKLVKPAGEVYLGIDLAKTNDWTVLYGARSTDRKVCLFERFQQVSWNEQKRMIRRAVRQLLNRGAESVTLIMDSTGVGDPIVEDMEVDGYDVVPINFTTWKNKMVNLLAKDLEQGGAWLYESQLHEFENYSMTITPGGKFTYSAPEGQHDDAVSAKMLSHWGMEMEGVPNVTTLDEVEDEPTEEETEAYEGLFDSEDEEQPVEKFLLPDSPASIMARGDAWL